MYCSKNITPDRLLRVVASAMARNPKLNTCSRDSLYLCFNNSAQLGVEPNLLGECYYIPYRNNKTGIMEAQFILGYRGLIKILKQSGEVKSIEARCVKDGDFFRYSFGLNPSLIHEPKNVSNELTHVYSIAVLNNGEKQFEVMTKAEVDAIRNISKSKDSGAWVDFYDEMAKKTVVRRLCKYLDLSVEVINAIEVDDDKFVVNTENENKSRFDIDIKDDDIKEEQNKEENININNKNGGLFE